MKSVQKELDNLFIEWKAAYPNDTISIDGILDESLYWSRIPRIVFLLKETYGDFFDIAPLSEDCPDGYGPDGGSYWFWRNLRSYQYIVDGIVNHDYNIPTNKWLSKQSLQNEIKDIMETKVTGIGYMNIKKIPGTSESNWKDIYAFAVKGAPFLVRQLQLLKPHIIFCCGFNNTPRKSIYECLKIIEPSFKNAKQLSNCVYENNGVLAIDWWHPSMSDIASYEWEQLIDTSQLNHPNVLQAITNMQWS